jgi:3-deoxy-manno-octulosonate cytidylyltransferase (CMP-KDO synthetase)
MILWVIERALAARNIKRAIVATDDRRILEAVRGEGFEALMTREDHTSGSDRLAEVAATLDDVDVIVNVQADEPLISPRTIELAVDELLRADEASIVTSYEVMTEAREVLSPDVVKVVLDERGRALYFSRSPIPYPRDAVREKGTLERALADDPSLVARFRKHTGFYAYRRRFLLEYSGWPQSELERTESLEQLRALERGVVIKAIEAHTPSIGVDTMEDLERVREMMKADAGC